MFPPGLIEDRIDCGDLKALGKPELEGCLEGVEKPSEADFLGDFGRNPEQSVGISQSSFWDCPS